MGLNEDYARKYEACCAGLREYAAGPGFTDVVIGLSGGIDSTLVAKICVDVFGADHVHGYMLPGPYSTSHSLDDARNLASNLGIDAEVISILAPFDGFNQALEHACGGPLAGLALENTQARCRMVCLMALSNTYGWMLVNTGNKSEAAMGFSTLYGDTAGAYAPIGGLYKTDVFGMCRWLNAQAQAAGEVPPIPEHVLTKPPSAELSPDAKDEVAMGIDYDTLDKILVAHYEHGISVDELAAEGFDREQVAYVVRRTDGYAFKRAMEPPFPAIEY